MTLRRRGVRRCLAATTFAMAVVLATALPANAITANATTYTTNTSTATIAAGAYHVWSFSTWADVYNAPYTFGSQTGNTNNYDTLTTYYAGPTDVGGVWYEFVGVANVGSVSVPGSFVAVSMNNGS